MTARDEEINTETIMRVGERADSKWDKRNKRKNNQRRMFVGLGLSEDRFFLARWLWAKQGWQQQPAALMKVSVEG